MQRFTTEKAVNSNLFVTLHLILETNFELIYSFNVYKIIDHILAVLWSLFKKHFKEDRRHKISKQIPEWNYSLPMVINIQATMNTVTVMDPLS